MSNIFRNGHPLWSITTLTLVFTPTCLSFFINHLLRCFRKRHLKKSRHKSESSIVKWSWSLPTFLRHFPLFQPLVHFSYLIQIKEAKDIMKKSRKIYKSIKQERHQNAKEMLIKASEENEKAKTKYAILFSEFQEMRLYEVFGESAPQSALQLAIMLQLGYLSYIQIFTIATSLFSVSMGSTNIFLLMPTKSKPVKTKTWQETFLMVFPAMSFIILARMLSWSLIIAYSKQYSLLFILGFIGLSLILNLRKLIKWTSLTLLSIFTNLFSPCIIIQEGSKHYLRYIHIEY